MKHLFFLKIRKQVLLFLLLSVSSFSHVSFSQETTSLFTAGSELNYLGTENYDETPLAVQLKIVFTTNTTCFIQYSLRIDGVEKDRFNDSLRILNTFAPECIVTESGDSVIANVYGGSSGLYLKLQQDFIVVEIETDNSKENKNISELAQLKLPGNRDNIVNHLPILYRQKAIPKRKRCFLKRKSKRIKE